MRFEKFIRLSPYVFVAAAIVDFVKQLLWLLPFWLKSHDQLFTDSDYEYYAAKFTIDFVDRLLAVFIYPIAWIGTAIIITLLLRIYDTRVGAWEAAE
jgi:hypothetical protein